MNDYKESRASELEENLARLIDLQSQPGADRDGHLLLLCLVNLMSLIDIMQKQLSGQPDSQPRPDTIKNKITNKIAEVPAAPAYKAPEPVSPVDQTGKVVNKVKGTAGRDTGKIVKWDSRFKQGKKDYL